MIIFLNIFVSTFGFSGSIHEFAFERFYLFSVDVLRKELDREPYPEEKWFEIAMKIEGFNNNKELFSIWFRGMTQEDFDFLLKKLSNIFQESEIMEPELFEFCVTYWNERYFKSESDLEISELFEVELSHNLKNKFIGNAFAVYLAQVMRHLPEKRLRKLKNLIFITFNSLSSEPQNFKVLEIFLRVTGSFWTLLEARAMMNQYADVLKKDLLKVYYRARFEENPSSKWSLIHEIKKFKDLDEDQVLEIIGMIECLDCLRNPKNTVNV